MTIHCGTIRHRQARCSTSARVASPLRSHARPCIEARCLAWFVLMLLLSCAGCHRDMRDQPRYEPDEPSRFFADGRSSRPLVAGTVARGQLVADEQFTTGKSNGQLLRTVPIPVTRSTLERGQNRFNIYCTPCHAPTGTGRGMVVQRGFRQPPEFSIARLREAPDGHVFDVITNGLGVMPPYSHQISPSDRWAIVTYVRALQLAQSASLTDVPPDIARQLQSAPDQAVSVPPPEPRASNDHLRSFRPTASSESTLPSQTDLRESPDLTEPETRTSPGGKPTHLKPGARGARPIPTGPATPGDKESRP